MRVLTYTQGEGARSKDEPVHNRTQFNTNTVRTRHFTQFSGTESWKVIGNTYLVLTGMSDDDTKGTRVTVTKSKHK